jgi:hypothetical protein
MVSAKYNWFPWLIECSATDEPSEWKSQRYFWCSAFFNQATTHLTNADSPELTWNLVEYQSFQSQAIIDCPENVAGLRWWQMYDFCVVVHQYSADTVGQILHIQ